MKRVALGVAAVVTVVVGGASACSGAEWAAPVEPPDGFAITAPVDGEPCGEYLLVPDSSIDDPYDALAQWVDQVTDSPGATHRDRPEDLRTAPDGTYDGGITGWNESDDGGGGFPVRVHFDGSRIVAEFCLN